MKRIISMMLILSSFTFAQSNGKISGVVTGPNGDPLPGANVLIVGTTYGAATDVNGAYSILNVPAGKHTVRFEYIGYATTIVQDLNVSSGLTTALDQVLEEETIEGQEVTVVAERPLIQVDKTSSINVVTAEDLENLPIRNLNDLVETIPGVVVQDDNIHIRGGRSNEVAFFVNGSPTTGMSDRENLVYVPQEATEEIQVQVGGYDASVGGANSGIITRQIRRGTSNWQGSFSYQNDGGGLGKSRFNTKSFGHNVMLANVSGPLLGDRVKFYAGFESNNQGDPFVTVGESFNFEGRYDSDPSAPTYGVDTVDVTWPGYREAEEKFTTFTSSLTFDFAPLIYNLSVVKTSEEDWLHGGIQGYMSDHGTSISPEGNGGEAISVPGRRAYIDRQRFLLTNEISFNLSQNTLIKVDFGYLTYSEDDHDEWFGTDWQKWFDSTAVQAELGIHDSVWTPFKDRFSQKSQYRINGIPFDRPGTMPQNFYDKFNLTQTSFNGSFVTAMDNHTITAGFNYRKYTQRELSINPRGIIYSADPAYGLATYGIETYGSWDAVPVDKKRVYVDGFGYDLEGKEIDDRKTYGDGEDVTYMDGAKNPTELGFYFQDKIEFDDIVVNAGIRFDKLDPDEQTLENPDSLDVYETSSYINLDEWKDVDPYTYIQPRLGISFPVSDVMKVYGYYGKFAQLPDLESTWYTAYDYRTQIARGGNFYTNPVGFGIEPIQTTQYEIGFSRQIGYNMALDITGFYKNQKGLVTVDRVESPKGDLASAYNVRVNGDFSTTKGLEFKFTLRRTNRLAAEMNYTFSAAEATGSGSTSYISAVDRGSQRPQMIMPVDFNQPHVGSVKLDYRFGDKDGGPVFENLGANVLFNFSSGHAYTHVYRPVGGQVDAYDAGVDYMLDTRSREALEPIGDSQTPWIFNTDLRMDKTFSVSMVDVTVFMRVNNLFDRRNVLNVYQATGSGDDDGFITDPVYSQSFIDLYGGDVDGNGVDDYVELYQAVNIDNDESYRTDIGGRLISAPRQIFLGLTVNF